MHVQSNVELIRQDLKSKMRESAATTSLRDSIRIRQVADLVDMTREAAEREMAMERIDHGSYGVCLECEEPISPRRLKAIPWAELCIICQEWADRSNAGANAA